jgi:hypothetical protein
MTTAVDRQGESVLYTSTANQILKRASEVINDNFDLLFSMAPEAVVNLEDRILACFGWFVSLGR